jgi:hypothetical protein
MHPFSGDGDVSHASLLPLLLTHCILLMPREPSSLSTHPNAVRSRERYRNLTPDQRRERRRRTKDHARERQAAIQPPVPASSISTTSDASVRHRARVAFERVSHLRPPAIHTPWRSETCVHCGALLLAAESSAWCCKNGSKVVPRLPPLPHRIQALAFGFPQSVSDHSRALNNLFCLSACGVSEGFTKYTGT